MSAQLDQGLYVSLDGQTPRVGCMPSGGSPFSQVGQEQLRATHAVAGIPSSCWLAQSLLSRALADLLLVGHHHPPMHG